MKNWAGVEMRVIKRIFVNVISLVALALSLASPAPADNFRNPQEFGDAYAMRICSELAQAPVRRTIWAMVSVWMTQTNLSYGQLQTGIGYAIYTYCPQYNDIYASYRSYYP